LLPDNTDPQSSTSQHHRDYEELDERSEYLDRRKPEFKKIHIIENKKDQKHAFDLK